MRTVALGDVADFIRGVTFKPADVADTPRPSDVRCLRTKNVQDELDIDDVWAIDSSFVRRPEQFLQAGDVIISTANSWNLVGKCSWVPELPWRATFGGFVTTLRPRPKVVDPRYLYRWMSWGHTQANLRSFGQRTTSISNMNLDRCRKMSIPLPPIEEQRRIAAILDAADELRAKRRAALAHLDSLTQSIFLNLFGDLDSTPRRWPSVRLDEIVFDSRIGLVRGSADLGPGLPYPYLRMNAITRQGELQFGDLRCTAASSNEVERYSLKEGDLLFNTRNSRELVGKTALYRRNETCLFNNNLMRIRFRRDLADPEFVAAALRTPTLIREIESRKSGTTNVFAVYFKDLRSLPVPLPPISLQRTFAQRVSVVRAVASTFQESASQMDSMLASLQQRAFSGAL